jgi:hypothetical protein
MAPHNRTKYIASEKKRGTEAFNPCVTAIFRGKQCTDLRRHFEPHTALREIVSNADFLAARDWERFIFVTKWKKVRETYSQSTIDTYLRVCERAGLFVPVQRIRKGKLRNGWIIKSHAELSEVIDGMCIFNVEFGGSGDPLRKNGERRWKAIPDSPGTLPDDPGNAGLSVGLSVGENPQSVGVSVGSSVGVSVASEATECISTDTNAPVINEIEAEADRKVSLNPLTPVSPVNPERENPVNPVREKEEAKPTALSLSSDLNPKADGQKMRDLVNELVWVCGGKSLFGKKCQGRLSEALLTLTPDQIIARWSDFWRAILPSDSASWTFGAADRFCKKLLENDPSLGTNPYGRQAGMQHAEFPDQAEAFIPDMSLGD